MKVLCILDTIEMSLIMDGYDPMGFITQDHLRNILHDRAFFLAKEKNMKKDDVTFHIFMTSQGSNYDEIKEYLVKYDELDELYKPF